MDPLASNESDLLAALRRGEGAAFEALVRINGGPMLAICRRILRSDADAQDALQDAFVSAFKSLDSFEGNSALSTWLHRIALTSSLMKLRAQKRRDEKHIEDMLPQFLADGHRANPGPAWVYDDDLAEADETCRLVRRCIEELPEDFRIVLLLRDIEEMETSQTAQLLGISQGAVKTRLHRARQALRTLLDPHLARGNV
jgi:RNA polymerase sigma-70 factor (ECF subfamily)